MNFNRYKVTEILTTNDSPVDLGEFAPIAKTFGDETAQPDSKYYVQAGGDDVVCELDGLLDLKHEANIELLKETKGNLSNSDEDLVSAEDSVYLLVGAVDNNVLGVLETIHSIGTRPSIGSYCSYVSIGSDHFATTCSTDSIGVMFTDIVKAATANNADGVVDAIMGDFDILGELLGGIVNDELRGKVKRKLAARLLNSITEEEESPTLDLV